ncbi:SidE phosphodiesterase domain-containing protein [Legionella quateirensis]|uniref:SidE PDE domain-containing protein n=1 Tax=Legionella quateirensis TaxID=45072 RepID=A0A378KZF0_9GAMM|nr:SidE phosphodiesterase domain-containing protein [Legionella quateirensis]KTD53009.1 hypothetical protein Lqua_0842 [Legionella quateirensis]STY17230.1 Uncharacterised protein [Legionella quateirensis]
MALTYIEIHNQLTTLLKALEKKVSFKGVVFNLEGKIKQIIHCRNILNELEQHQNSTQFALAEFLSDQLNLHKPSIKTNKILNKFYKRLGELHQQLITCDDVSDILKRKGIEPFDPQKDTIRLSDDISVHSKLLFKKVYSRPHILDVTEVTEINRDLHGLQHVNRVAYYIPVLVNLYRRYGDVDAEALTSEDIKLIQIAALFHDAGRERGEGIDYWDQDSALLAFYYYSKVLQVSDAKAKLLAEAIANKDMKEGKYYQLVSNEHGELSWKLIKQRKKNIYQKVLHDSDSIDVLRARSTNSYNAQYLDFYQDIAKENTQAKDEMTELIYEARSLIENQGDGFLRQKSNVKKYYEHVKGYQRTVTQIAASTAKQSKYHVLRTLYTPDIDSLPLKQLQQMKLINKPVAYDPEHVLDEVNMHAAMEQGIVFARGIADPSATVNKNNKNIETQAELEIRKTLRRKGKPTRTQKADRLMKHGNPNRSVALVGFGAVPFAAAGFLIVDNDPKHQHIKSIAKTNIVSGFGKKKTIAGVDGARDDVKLKETALLDLIASLQIGGGNNKSAHSEIIYNVDQFDAIYFTQDAVFANKQLRGTTDGIAEAFHKHAPLLQAIYLQKEYEKQTGIKLTLFEYSGIHRFTKEQADINNSDSAALFRTMCRDFIHAQVASSSPEFLTMTVEQIKIFSMYGDLYAVVGREKKFLQAADTYLPDELRESINTEIETELQKAKDRVVEQLRNKSLSLFSPMALNVLKLMKRIPKDLRGMIVNAIESHVTQEVFYKDQFTNLFDQILAKKITNQADELFNILNYLKNYSEIIKNNKKLENFEQMTVALLNSYVKNNIDKIMKLGFGSKITLCFRIKKIVDLLSLHNKIDPDLLADLVVLFSNNLPAFNHLKLYVSLDHPKVVVHVHQLIANLPYINGNFDVVSYLTEAKKNGLSEQHIVQGVAFFIDKMMEAKKTVSGAEFCQVMAGVSFQGKNVIKKISDLLCCTRINSLRELIDILNSLKHSQIYIKKHQLSDILTQLSQKLLDSLHTNPDFYIVPAYDTHESFIAALDELPSLKCSDTYKRNMLTFIKMAPDNERGLYFIERIRTLNLKLGFDVDLQLNTHASAAALSDKENSSNNANLVTRHSFFVSNNTTPLSTKHSNETKEEKYASTPNKGGI